MLLKVSLLKILLIKILLIKVLLIKQTKTNVWRRLIKIAERLKDENIEFKKEKQQFFHSKNKFEWIKIKHISKLK